MRLQVNNNKLVIPQELLEGLTEVEVSRKELNQTVASSHLKLAETMEEQGLIDEAVSAYRRVLTLNPNSPDVYHKLGFALARIKRWDEAISAYRQALELHPNSAAVHYHLGEALINLGLEEQAIASYEKAVELKPDYKNASQALEKLLAKNKGT